MHSAALFNQDAIYVSLTAYLFLSSAGNVLSGFRPCLHHTMISITNALFFRRVVLVDPILDFTQSVERSLGVLTS